MDRIRKPADLCDQSSIKKRKRKKVLPQERKRRALEYRNAQKKNVYRSAIRDSRIYAAVSKFEFICDAIDASNKLLDSLKLESSKTSLIIDIERELRLMKDRANRYQRELESAQSTPINKRCKRKRKKRIKSNIRYINVLIRRRRHDRISNKPAINYSQVSKSVSKVPETIGKNRPSLFDSDESDSDHSNRSNQSVDSELEDETYVPEVFCKKRRKRRKAWGKRGNNESNLAHQEDIFAEEYESLNDKYQFAIDLKTKDHQPGKEVSSYVLLIVNSNSNLI